MAALQVPVHVIEYIHVSTACPDEVWEEFVTTVIDVYGKTKPAKKKAYDYFADKFGTESKVIQTSSQAIVFFLLEACKATVTESDFKSALESLPSSKVNILWMVYSQRQEALRQALDELSVYIPHYVGLEWRFDVQLASRSCFKQMEPSLTVALGLQGESSEHQKINFTCDIPNLVHAVEVLELALNNCNNYVKKVQRSYNKSQ